MSLPNCQNGVFLTNREITKKSLEAERRILRLQQVRNESRNIARKLRTDVAAEKQRQLLKLQATKEKELELWRRSVLVKKYDDYRSAVFHIGDAHAAAKAESEGKSHPQESLFRRQVRTRQSFNKYDPRNFNKKKMEKSKLIKTTMKATQTANKENVTTEESTNNNKKHKWHDEDLIESDESEDVESCCQLAECIKEKLNLSELKQTPAVVEEVDNSQLYGNKTQKPAEIKDNFVQNNRQFTHVISDNKKKYREDEKVEPTMKPRFNQVSQVLQKIQLNDDKTSKIIEAKGHKESNKVEENMPKPSYKLPTTTVNNKENTFSKSAIESSPIKSKAIIPKHDHVFPSLENVIIAQKELQLINNEREKACKDIKILTEKLESLGHDCCRTEFTKETQSHLPRRKQHVKPATPPQTPQKLPQSVDRGSSAPTSPVARRKVDRASSPNPSEIKTTTDNSTERTVIQSNIETVDRASSPLLVKRTEVDKGNAIKTTESSTMPNNNNNTNIEMVDRGSSPFLVKTETETASKFRKPQSTDRHVDHKEAQLNKNPPKITKTQTTSLQKNANSLVLLDYATEQSKMLSKDMNDDKQKSNPDKARCLKLKKLLTNNEKIRKQMYEIFERCRVLNFSNDDLETLKELIKEMCKISQEREILFKDKNSTLESKQPNKVEATQQKTKPVEKVKIQKDPVEIIITVKGAQPLEGSIFNNKEPVKLTLNGSIKPVEVKPTEASVKEQNTQEILYDSESTHYKSLPKNIHSTMYDYSDEDTHNNIQTSKEEIKHKSKTNINPLIKQYVDRLLSMRRSSVRALKISTSDIETPSDSVINVTSNQLQKSVDMSNSQQYIESAENFITENYKFLNKLEESLYKKENTSLEKNIKIGEKLWKLHLEQEQKEYSKTQIKLSAKSEIKPDSKETTPISEKKKIASEKSVVMKPRVIETPKKENKELLHKEKDNKKLQQISRNDKKPLTKPTETTTETYADKLQKSMSKNKTQLKTKTNNIETENAAESKDQHMNNFSELANSCSQRINDLNNMITRVREEKQRLVENTYSSISIASPEPTSTKDVEKNQEEEVYLDSVSINELPDCHAALTGSRDSGIDNSRPVTRQEASAETSTATTETSKHSKPPAVLKRFSPQLNEELAIHELSTIVEVDTPIASNNRLQNTKNETKTVNENADASKLNALEEFMDFLHLVRRTNNVNSFAEFPSLSTYLKKVEKGEIKDLTGTLGEDSNQGLDAQLEDLFNSLRLSHISVKSFPTPKEYTRRLQQSSSTEMLSSESLENLTEENDSDTMDIEAELRNRNLLVEPFQVANNKSKVNESSTKKKEAAEGVGAWATTMIRRMQETNALSSGTSTSPSKMTNTTKQTKSHKLRLHLNSSTASGDDDSTLDSLGGRELNLRDFLQRELSRHFNSTSLSTSSHTGSNDISLRHQFLNSILDSMTPKTQASSNGISAPHTDHQLRKNDTQNNLVTHKTSTPVQSFKSRSQEYESSNSNTLFSCESHVSSVAKINRKANK